MVGGIDQLRKNALQLLLPFPGFPNAACLQRHCWGLSERFLGCTQGSLNQTPQSWDCESVWLAVVPASVLGRAERSVRTSVQADEPLVWRSVSSRSGPGFLSHRQPNPAAESALPDCCRSCLLLEDRQPPLRRCPRKPRPPAFVLTQHGGFNSPPSTCPVAQWLVPAPLSPQPESSLQGVAHLCILSSSGLSRGHRTRAQQGPTPWSSWPAGGRDVCSSGACGNRP